MKTPERVSICLRGLCLRAPCSLRGALGTPSEVRSHALRRVFQIPRARNGKRRCAYDSASAGERALRDSYTRTQAMTISVNGRHVTGHNHPNRLLTLREREV